MCYEENMIEELSEKTQEPEENIKQLAYQMIEEMEDHEVSEM